MKTSRLVSIACLALASSCGPTALAQGTAFSYQGLLNGSGAPASGLYDFTFAAYDSPTNGNLISSLVTNSAVTVSNGLFTTLVDFGSGIFEGQALWLEIAVSTNGAGSFGTLAPRQMITPTPYALYASAAETANSVVVGSITAGQLQTPGAPSGGQVLAYDGTQLVWEDPNNSQGWSLTGNSGTIPGVNFLGTLDNQALDFKVGGTRALRLQPDTGNVGAPNVIGGSVTNWVDAGVYGAFIGGGGATNVLGIGIKYPNHISGGANFGSIVGGGSQNIQSNAAYASIGGGFGNLISPFAAFAHIAGGEYNSIFYNAHHSGIGGGDDNQTYSVYSAIGGGYVNLIQPGADDSLIGAGEFSVIGTNSYDSTISGGGYNVILPNAPGATIPGGSYNQVGGAYSFAAGYYAAALSSGSFVWADASSTNTFASFAPNQFLVRATGGVGITGGLNVSGPLTVGNNFVATIGCGDLFIGYSTRRGTPGRAISDLGSALSLNCCGDWATTYVGGGNVSVCTLTIRGGCDVSEPFPTAEEHIEKGTVLIIDEEHPGQLRRSEHAYDTRVAGIASGANGINPGISLRQEGVLDSGQDVALSGRVYVQADAGFGSIKAGDLLTTSETPGYAMKVTDHTRAQGAVLGKAMSGLAKGKGMVLVLVSLQ